MKEASFDFGKKPPVDGYTKVTEKSIYTKEKGFGLSEVAEADERKIGEKELNRDFLFMGGKSFIVDIENGEYIVRVSTGDYVDEGDVMTFYNVNGEKYGVWVSDGTVVERVFPVTVTDGKIEFAFEMGKHTCLNSIDIAQKQDIEVKNVKSAVIAKRDTASVKLTWDRKLLQRNLLTVMLQYAINLNTVCVHCMHISSVRISLLRLMLKSLTARALQAR